MRKSFERIAASIAEFGFVNPVLVATDDGIIAGRGASICAAAIHAGETADTFATEPSAITVTITPPWAGPHPWHY